MQYTWEIVNLVETQDMDAEIQITIKAEEDILVEIEAEDQVDLKETPVPEVAPTNIIKNPR